MAKVPSGPRPPDHSPLLRDYVYHITSYHEAAHTVAAYMFNVPFLGATVGEFKNFRMQGPHLLRDHVATKMAETAIVDRKLPTGKLFEAEFVVVGIAYHVNVAANAVPTKEAKFYARDDDDTLAGLIRLNGIDAATEKAIRKIAYDRCVALLNDPKFQKAVGAVAEALRKRVGYLGEGEIIRIIENAVGTALKNPVADPSHAEIELAAYQLYQKRGDAFDALANWLCAERALRYEKASTIIP